MAGDKKVTEFTTANPLVGDEIFPLIQAGQNKRVTLNGIKNFVSIGGSADLSDIVCSEIPTGNIDGTNRFFLTTNSFISSSVGVYCNGLRLMPGVSRDYVLNAPNQIELNFVPQIGDTLLCDYIKD